MGTSLLAAVAARRVLVRMGSQWSACLHSDSVELTIVMNVVK